MDAVWTDFLQYAESTEDVGRERRKQKVSAALEGLNNEDVWKEVQRRKSGAVAVRQGDS